MSPRLTPIEVAAAIVAAALFFPAVTLLLSVLAAIAPTP